MNTGTPKRLVANQLLVFGILLGINAVLALASYLWLPIESLAVVPVLLLVGGQATGVIHLSVAAALALAACLIECPTGAIGKDRFLLHAERRLVFHNERPAGVPFPDWIDPAWHNALFGCTI